MKKTFIKVLCVVLALLVGATVIVAASEQLKTISAYLNCGVTVKYDGEAQTMYDANGAQVYPITYNGTTYLPARAIAAMFGIGVNWDGPSNTVLLGAGAVNTSPEIVGNYNGYTVTQLPYLANGITINSASFTTTKATLNVTNNSGSAIGGNSTVAYTCYDEHGNLIKTSTFYLENMNDGESAVVSFVFDKKTAKILFGDVTTRPGAATDSSAATCSIIEVTKLPYEISGLTVNSVSVSGTKVTVNVTNNTGAAIKAISNIAYKCYDANGAVIKSGGFSLAAMNDGEAADTVFYVESGTVKILFGDATVYNQ